MIHEVHLPSETKKQLSQVVRLQMDILNCAVDLSDNFNIGDLETALKGRMEPDRAEEVAKWIFRARKSRLEHLWKFAKASKHRKRKIVKSMQCDIDVLSEGDVTKTLKCSFHAENKLPSYLKGVKSFLIAFYNQLSEGIDRKLFINHSEGKYGREQFFSAYQKGNPRQQVCVFCDDQRPTYTSKGKRRGQMEHYFPKSIYPHLACHPFNLIPICSNCNSVHHNTDPLTRNGSRIKLGQVFLPYRGESVHPNCTVVFSKDKDENKCKEPDNTTSSSDESGKPEPPPYYLFIGPSPKSPITNSEDKLKVFHNVFDIPCRWQYSIDAIGAQLLRDMKYYIKAELDGGLELSEVRGDLKRLLNRYCESLGEEPWRYMLLWYLGYLLQTKIEGATNTSKSMDALWETLEKALISSKKKPLSRHEISLSVDSVLETSRELYT